MLDIPVAPDDLFYPKVASPFPETVSLLHDLFAIKDVPENVPYFSVLRLREKKCVWSCPSTPVTF